jgi:ParB family chromosome partitioning protein
MITNIEISRLLPHVDNPRKDLGDLSELADSIRASGILQNLTIVPVDSNEYVKKISNKKKYKGDYTVVIGHRRLAAAKLAGLAEVPCVVSDMKAKTQLATMLLENMQRSDLSVYEQAHGFHQLTLLGEDEGTIAEMTGFSKSTVNRRLRLARFDLEKVKAAGERGATLSDFDELYKIKDAKLRNEAFEKIGTNGFKFEVSNAISREESQRKTAAFVEKVAEFASEYDGNFSGKRHAGYIFSQNYDSYQKPNDTGEVKYFYKVCDHHIELYAELSEAEMNSKSEEEESRKSAEAGIEERRVKLAELTKIAYNLRYEFVQNFKPKKEHLPTIAMIGVLAMENDTFDGDMTCEMLGYSEAELEEDEGLSLVERVENSGFMPEKALLITAYSAIDGDWIRGGFQLEKLYEYLERLGYLMSDEERELISGAHELYTKVEVAENGDNGCKT